MPSGKKTRKAERDATKRTKIIQNNTRAAEAGAAAAGAVAAVAASASANPLGDWTSQTLDPTVLVRVLGPEHVKVRAAEGDPAAQYSVGHWLLSEANVETRQSAANVGTALGAAGRTPQAEAGPALSPKRFRSLTTLGCICGHHLKR
jgi:hypothetical protein